MHPHIRRPPRIPFFRIFYSTTFTVLTLILAAAVLITPGDHIYQAFHAGQIYHIFIIAGFYVLTFIVTLLLYGGRLYKTRTSLAGVPREWNITPEGKGVGMKLGRVGKEIQSGLERSAWIAYEARPRDLSGEKRNDEKDKNAEKASRPLTEDSLLRNQITPPWGIVSHPGWSSPSSIDLPNLHYEPVILELPHLIEAKAVSLAPPDPQYDPSMDPESDETPPPDPLAIDILRRPIHMGLRDYIAHLSILNIITPATIGKEFVTVYEQARFSGEASDEIEFRGLLSIFAEVLRGMKPLEPSILEGLHADEPSLADDNLPQINVPADDGASVLTNETVAHTPQPDIYYTPQPDGYTSDIESGNDGDDDDDERQSLGTVHTAPSRPGNPRTATNLSRSTRASRRRGVHTPSMETIGRVGSASPTLSAYSGRSTAGSVIMLAEARTELDLPYEFVVED